ncbi:hypothetical protein G5V57_04555 [Nordella sp. HKS 07]|nr:hypothetical protein [Nordella sp. HKS 07]QIG47078.1 hypothetical protein G5V57_04555 [Nordella sp. HKS 07]
MQQSEQRRLAQAIEDIRKVLWRPKQTLEAFVERQIKDALGDLHAL